MTLFKIHYHTQPIYHPPCFMTIKNLNTFLSRESNFRQTNHRYNLLKNAIRLKVPSIYYLHSTFTLHHIESI